MHPPPRRPAAMCGRSCQSTELLSVASASSGEELSGPSRSGGGHFGHDASCSIPPAPLRPRPVRPGHSVHRRRRPRSGRGRRARRGTGRGRLRRPGAQRYHRRVPDHLGRREGRVAARGAGSGGRAGAGGRGRRQRRHPAHRGAGPAGGTSGRRRPAGRDPVLQPAAAGRRRGALPAGRRVHRPPADAVRHPRPHRHPHRTGDGAATGRAPACRGGEGLLAGPAGRDEGDRRHRARVLLGLRGAESAAVRGGRRGLRQYRRQRGAPPAAGRAGRVRRRGHRRGGAAERARRRSSG